MRDSYIFLDDETVFEGKISTDHVVLEGIISGEIEAKKDILLKKGSKVKGKIFTQKFTVEEGAVHHGEIRMDSDQNGKLKKVSLD